MGSLRRVEMETVAKEDIKPFLNRLVDYDFSTRETEHDMYRGDFGACSIGKLIHTYKGKSEKVIQKNFDKFDESADFTKHVIDYAIIGQLGYIARAAKVTTLVDGAKGPFRVGDKTYANVTELKKALKSTFVAKSLYGHDVIQLSSWNKVGRINAVSRNFKTKPKALPQKYQWLDELVVIGYGSETSF